VTEQILEVDDRRRVSLGRLAEHSRYLVRKEDDGTLILEPAVVLTAFEARVLGNSEVLAKLREAQAAPRGAPRRRRTAPVPD
jgi:hypothetical protein